MPSSHPIPSLASLCLALWYSNKRVQRLPLVSYVMPYETAAIVPVPASLASTLPAVAGLRYEIL